MTKELPHLTRRRFLTSSVRVAIAAPLFFVPKAIIPESTTSTIEEHSLHIINTHTGESLKQVFWGGGEYDLQALESINHLLRDHRTNESHPIDKNLLHLLHQIRQKLETEKPFELISGYRSPKSNRMLHQASSGVAKNSQHVYGKAVDIAVPGRTMKQLQLAAKSLKAGGVGRYAQFVHVDTGRIRYWGKV